MPLAARSYVRRSQAARWARRIGALAVPVLVLGALGHRTGAVPTDAIVPVLNVGFGLAVTAAGLALFAFIDIWLSGAHGFRDAVIGVIYALPALALIGAATAGVLLNPRLTDVSTDVIDVPPFTTVSSADDDDVDRTVQLEAYPEITARFYQFGLDQVFAAARALAEDRGWSITSVREPVPPSPPPVPSEPATDTPAAASIDVAVEPQPAESSPPPRQASIEAIARTLLFAFPDHVVIRLTESGAGTRVDMRSASEIGAHDLGQNARRITSFFAELDTVLQGVADAGAGEVSVPSVSAPAVPPGRPANR